MAEKKGIKESLEALVAALKIAKAIKKVAKDGLQLHDLAALAAVYQSDAALKAAIDAGLKDIALAKEEIKDLDLADGLALAAGLMPAIQDFLAE